MFLIHVNIEASVPNIAGGTVTAMYSFTEMLALVVSLHLLMKDKSFITGWVNASDQLVLVL